MQTREGDYLYASLLVAGAFIYMYMAFIPAQTQAATNLISNPGFESAGPDGLPIDWKRGRFGTNTAIFEYPVAGVNGSKAAKVTISQYTSGDAKWFFKNVPVTPGKEYEYSDSYTSSISNHVTVQYQMSDGSFAYKDIASPSPAASFSGVSARFVVPSGAASLTIFHLIKQVGSLSIDNASLTEVLATPPPAGDPANLIQNFSFENMNTSGGPASWLKGRSGINATSFIYPVAGHSGARAARINMESRSSGDAKWYFPDIPVNPGEAYSFSNFSRSDQPTHVTARFKRSDGSFFYQDIGFLGPSSPWQNFQISFTVPQGAVSLTIFHLIKSNGFLEVDDYILKKLASDPTHFDKGHISLNFDDGWLSAYQNAIPILNQAGFKSGQFIITERLNPNDFPAYVKANQILDMQAHGHEIGAHSRTHPFLTTLSPADAEAEIAGSRNDLLAIGASPANIFAYPFGDYNDQIKEMVKDSGYAAARSSDGGYNLKTQDTLALRRQSITVSTTFNEIKNYIDTALADKTWVILLFHEVNNSGNKYSITPALFQDVVNYLKQKAVQPITISEGIGLMKK